MTDSDPNSTRAAERLGVSVEEYESRVGRGLSPCAMCRRWLPVEEFYSGKGPGNTHTYCRACFRDYYQARRRGISVEAFRALSCGVCGARAIYGRVSRDVDVDGREMGWLCGPCRVGLDAFDRDADRFDRAIEYLGRSLESFKQQQNGVPDDDARAA